MSYFVLKTRQIGHLSFYVNFNVSNLMHFILLQNDSEAKVLIIAEIFYLKLYKKLIYEFNTFQVSVRSSAAAPPAPLNIANLGGGSDGDSSATMRKLGLALYFMSTMAVMVMNM